jgi:type IX secretion system PorP/SprF family membrane protein
MNTQFFTVLSRYCNCVLSDCLFPDSPNEKKSFQNPMRKVILCVLAVFTFTGFSYSQIDPQFSQYMFHSSSFNPAAVGEGDMIQATAQHRLQWIGFRGAPQSTAVSVNGPIKLAKNSLGVGISFLNDKAGLFSNRAVHLQGAYKKQLEVGTLSFGLDIGAANIIFSGDSLSAYKGDDDYHSQADPIVPLVSSSGVGFDLNAGVFYSNPTFYGGLSYSHVTAPTITAGSNFVYKILGTMYLTAGYNYLIPDTKIVLKPSTLIKTNNFKVFQLDLGARAEFNNKIWGGLAYRIDDAVVFLFGLNVASGLGVGLSYDLITSRINTASVGSAELLVTYSFDYIVKTRTAKYKSVRIL